VALATAAPPCSAEMREHFAISENKRRAALGMLRSQGKVVVGRQGGGAIWDVVK